VSRTISAALTAENAKTITELGYLVRFSTPSPIQVCDIGTLVWNSMTFIKFGFKIPGLGGSVDAAQEPSFTAQNLDNSIGAELMNADFSKVICDVWQVSRNATAVSDAVRLGRFMCNGCSITNERIEMRLLAENSLDSFSPRRRIDPYNGFYYALPDGTKIVWENETYMAEIERA
jgi:hypothetical protein